MSRENAYAEFFGSMVDEIARHLERMAEDVRSRGHVRTNPKTGKPDFLYSAKDVIHTVMWGVANANLDGLVARASDAAEADHNRDEVPS